jgi:mannose-6-phosphate isomerase-like protein (cupin superfamily)
MRALVGERSGSVTFSPYLLKIDTTTAVRTKQGFSRQELVQQSMSRYASLHMKLENAQSSLRMPGATLLTRLRVYDTVAPDGQMSGTPHFHLVCSELYFTLAGAGAVEIIDAQGFRSIPLTKHSAFLFSPGTLHRLVNTSGDMEVLLVMENSGLPERGDTIATFSNEVLAKDAFGVSLEAGRAALETIYGHARARTASRHKEWYDVVTHGSFDEAQNALLDIVKLQNGKTEQLFDAQHFFIPPVDTNTVGFCGSLNRYFDPMTLLPEGVKI